MSISRRRSLPQLIINLHWGLIFLTILLCGIGLAMLYSAAGGSFQPWAASQGVRFLIGLGGMFVVALLPLNWLLRFAYPLYGLGIGLLIFVELFGRVGMGAQRWIDLGFMVLQPSEPMKLALILVLSRYFHRMNPEEIGRISLIIPPLILLAIPVLLILKQPNLGTATILTLAAVAIFWAAGVRLWKFMLVGISGLAAMPIAWTMLHDYQKTRVMTFLNPEQDPLGAGYNIIQSMIAIGSGGIYGRGFLQGPQSQLNFLPEKHTDFIFTMLAEEFGFYGSTLLLAGYLLLMLFGYHIALSCQHQFGRLITIGVVTYFFVHMFINMAMVMGMIPVVGVPLPFLSYGGTMLMTSLLAVGLMLNIYLNRSVKLPRTAD